VAAPAQAALALAARDAELASGGGVRRREVEAGGWRRCSEETRSRRGAGPGGAAWSRYGEVQAEPVLGGGGRSREAEAGVGRRGPASGGGGQRREAAALLGRDEPVRSAEVVRERELFGRGENEGSDARPLRERGAGWGRGVEARPSPALPRCEARIELLYGAGLRGIFRSNWALPAWSARANKQLIF
jgi:hypothetical protein